MATYKLAVDLPGHQDEVFAVRSRFPLLLLTGCLHRFMTNSHLPGRLES